jgi:hypothetical protein
MADMCLISVEVEAVGTVPQLTTEIVAAVHRADSGTTVRNGGCAVLCGRAVMNRLQGTSPAPSLPWSAPYARTAADLAPRSFRRTSR